MGFGLVLGQDGRRLRTKNGGAVRLLQLLDEAAARAQLVIDMGAQQNGDAAGGAGEQARSMGAAAVTYAIPRPAARPRRTNASSSLAVGLPI